jgi:hypothetical protein
MSGTMVQGTSLKLKGDGYVKNQQFGLYCRVCVGAVFGSGVGTTAGAFGAHQGGGLMSAPLIATWVWDQVMKQESKLATVIANVFSPLFLVLTIGYLLALMGEQRSPFSDREFLIIFNALLLVVWAITVFSVTGRGEEVSRLLDLTNLSLVFVTLVIDAIALSAIAYRIIEFGITPNRMAVSGANLLIFVHLVWIFYEYVKELRGRSSLEVIKQTIARFLPVYTAWSLFVVVLLPVLFRFQ